MLYFISVVVRVSLHHHEYGFVVVVITYSHLKRSCFCSLYFIIILHYNLCAQIVACILKIMTLQFTVLHTNT